MRCLLIGACMWGDVLFALHAEPVRRRSAPHEGVFERCASGSEKSGVATTGWRKEVEDLEQAIGQLVDLRDKELARAARRQNDGDRIIHQYNSLLDARRAWADADAGRRIAARYQKEIDELERQRDAVLRKHGELPDTKKG